MGKISHSDLQVVANGSDGFTGADLQALLCTAQINLSQSKLKIIYRYIYRHIVSVQGVLFLIGFFHNLVINKVVILHMIF